jgi:hypothetical protein
MTAVETAPISTAETRALEPYVVVNTTVGRLGDVLGRTRVLLATLVALAIGRTQAA